MRGVILSSYIFACKQINKPNECKKTLQETKGAITNEQYIDTRHKTNTTQKTKKTNNTDPTKIGGEPTC